jgi:DNA-binding NtrC family response regulator
MNAATAPARIQPVLTQHDPAPPEAVVAPARPVILVATVDPDIRKELGELLDVYGLKVVWAKSVEEVRNVLAKETVAACFCGFWLLDGTYRDVVRQLKRRPVEIPAIIVCAPACPHEYTDYLAALKIRTCDFICHPYQRSEVERVFPSAIRTYVQSTRVPDSSTRLVNQTVSPVLA